MKLFPYKFTALFTLAAIIYNSWPLGYLLNNPIATSQPASALENTQQPNAWVFIAGDVVSGLILMSTCIYILRAKHKAHIRSRWLYIILIGTIMFGFFTAYGASAPTRCGIRHVASICITIGSRQLSPDAIDTSLAAFGAMLAFIASTFISLRLNMSNKIISWSLLVVWAVFSGLLAHDVNAYLNIHSIEQIYLIICGLGLAFIGYNLDTLKQKLQLKNNKAG